MLKQEFEKLAIRKDSKKQEISGLLWDKIEQYYMSDNDYHAAHGGINETKQDFIKRVFGGKVNTPKTILEKMVSEAIRENRWALQGNKTATKDRLDQMDAQITDHINWLALHNY